MSVYVRIPRRLDLTPTYKWEKYVAEHTWSCAEYVKVFEYNVYVAVNGQPQYSQLINTIYLSSPFESGLSPTSQLEYYEYTGNSTEQFVTMYPVSSIDRNAYPDGGSKEGDNYEVYYYDYAESNPVMYTGEIVTSKNENAYPNNGLHTDGYWYKKI